MDPPSNATNIYDLAARTRDQVLRAAKANKKFVFPFAPNAHQADAGFPIVLDENVCFFQTQFSSNVQSVTSDLLVIRSITSCSLLRSKVSHPKRVQIHDERGRSEE